ncbi:glycogen-binding domain-containing protein [Fibrobacter sp. UWB12]|uniref:glycogen-binding domain-containing protein n=1 Tax=Fibrobacter sp. UWB12 TaxID=1896203 RepID=UPI0009155839|nr:glycogen-binding domain-containing protein [Fibrobacter sp. UWB12]SHK98493.1 Glycogen recognition site of AMP-activated protein kinase [Fibrobacter sp. UWB12]
MSKNSKTVVEKPAAKKTAAAKAPKAPAKKAEAKAAPAKKATKTVAEAPKAEKSPAKKATKSVKAAAPKKVAVEFIADCPLATTVSIAGTFNDWAVDVDMLKKDKKTGFWVAKISLVPGDYEYKFVCDGKNWDAGDNKIKHV